MSTSKIEVEVRGANSGGTSAPVPVNPGNVPPASPQPGGVISSSPSSSSSVAGTPASSTPSGSAMPPVGGSASATAQGSQALNDRLAADIRREIATRGVVLVPGTANFTTLMQQITRQVGDNNSQAITQKYAGLRTDLAQRIKQEGDDALAGPRGQAIMDTYNANLANAQTQADRDWAEDQKNKAIDALLTPILKRGKQEGNSLDEREANEKQEAEKALSQAMQELTNEFRRGNPNSYLGKLREQYRVATWQRDNAESEDDVKRYSKEAKEISKKISEAQNGGEINRLAQVTGYAGTAMQIVNRGAQGYDAYWDTQMTHMRAMGSMARGDVFGAELQENAQERSNDTLMGAGIGTVVGGIVGGLLGAFTTFGFGTAAGIAGGMALGGMIGGGGGHVYGSYQTKDEDARAVMGQTLQGIEKQANGYNTYATMRNGTRGGAGIDSWRQTLISRAGTGYSYSGAEDEDDADDIMENMSASSVASTLWSEGGSSRFGGASLYDLGFNGGQFSEQVANRIRQRGYVRGGFDKAEEDAFAQMALERIYNLNDGAIGQLSAYDRYSTRTGKGYTNNSTQDVANLVASLQSRNVVGFQNGQALRTQEYMGYQTQLMEAQKAWMNPNSQYAQRQLLTAQNLFGNNIDSRAISELNQINSKVQNPGGGFADALMYDVIQKLHPDARGNLLKIRQYQYSNDANTNAEIQAAMAKRLEKIYGGVNTTSGYLAMSEFYGIKDPDRLAAWMGKGGIKSGYNASIQKGDVDSTVSQIKGYTPEISKQLTITGDQTLAKLYDLTKTYSNSMIQIVRRIHTDLQVDINAFKKAIHG